jgi:ABC-type uncharacterized transport system substrate-binding protein
MDLRASCPAAAYLQVVKKGMPGLKLRAGALIITADGLFADRLDQVAALARRYSVPATFQFREFAAAGGLISYGPNIADTYRQAGILAGRILRGENPADLPVMQPTKFELVINMKTAKDLGLRCRFQCKC